MTTFTGRRIGAYELVSPLGAGGMGEVYRARDSKLGRDVALKLLPRDLADDPERRARMVREARAAASLNHPNICTIYEVGEADGQHFIAMEVIEGQPLSARLAERRLPLDEVLRIALQLTEAVAHAHDRGIVHRDLKGANVMIVPDGRVKVLDFGLAKRVSRCELTEVTTQSIDLVTQPHTIIGTLPYMSPEQLRGEPADARSDVWALGVVLYEMLNGRLPFTEPTALEISAAILEKPVPPLPASVPLGLRTIVERCLAKPPEARYQHAGEIRSALGGLESRPDPRPRSAGWRPWQLAAGALVVAALTAAIVLQPWRSSDATRRLSTGGPASSNQEANDAFELAMNFQTVQNDIPRAQQILEHALELDPRFAEALRYHASNYSILILNGYTNDTSLLYKAEEELRQTARLDPDLLSLPAANAMVYLAQGRKELIPWDRLERVIQQDPSNVNNRLWRGIGFWLSGDSVAAKRDFRAALDLRPLFGPGRMFLAATLHDEGDLTGAIVELEKVLQQAPNNISAISALVPMYLDEGEPGKAHALLEAKRPLFSSNYLWRQSWALVLAVEGHREEALQAMDAETLKFSAAAFPSTLGAAEFYAVIGDTSKALEWLERAVRNGDERTDWFRRSPRLASIRDDPRFAQIIASLNARRKPQPG